MHVLVAIYGSNDVWTIPASQVEVLRQRFPRVTFSCANNEAETLGLIVEADVAFTSVLTRKALASAKRLRWVHSSAAGVGSMLASGLGESNVVLTNSKGMNAAAAAEHAFALILSAYRRIPDAVRAQRDRCWKQAEMSGLPTLRGRTLGVVGLGAIGSEIARIGAGIGMRVIGTRREVDAPLPEGVAEVLPPSGLDVLLAASDIVVLAVPLTGKTRRMITASELQRMKPTAWLVNVARGKLIDEAALVEALRAGTIAGAALDVFEHEPLDAASPLWNLRNVLVTPHVAGFREDYWAAATDLFSDNLRRYLAGEPLQNVVRKDAGY